MRKLDFKLFFLIGTDFPLWNYPSGFTIKKIVVEVLSFTQSSLHKTLPLGIGEWGLMIGE